MTLPRLRLPVPAVITDRLASLAARLPWPGRGEPMSPLRRRLIKAVCYTVFGLAAFGLFFAFGYLENNLERLVRDGLAGQDAVTVEWAGLKAEPGLPPRLAADGCVIKRKDNGAVLATLDHVALWPALSGLMAGRLGVGFEARAFEGLLSGTVGTGTFSLGSLRLALDATNVDLAKVPQAKAFDPEASGLASLDLVCTVPVGESGGLDLASADGTVWALVSGGRMKNLIPLFTVQVLEVDRALVDLDFDGRSIDLGRLNVQSPLIEGTLDGTLEVDWANLGNTKLALRGQVKPDPERTVLDVLEPKAAKAIREGRPISIEVTDTLATAMIRMR